MYIAIGGLTAECDPIHQEEVSMRMLYILHDIPKDDLNPSHVIIVDRYDKVYYEVENNREVKSEIPL